MHASEIADFQDRLGHASDGSAVAAARQCGFVRALDRRARPSGASIAGSDCALLPRCCGPSPPGSTEEVLAEIRASLPPASYPVGTPKGRLTKYEVRLLKEDWHQAREGVDVKLLTDEGEPTEGRLAA